MASNSVLGNGGFHHLAMNVSDFDRSIAFYTEVLGFSIFRQWKSGEVDAAMLDTGGGNYLEIFSRGTSKESGNLIHFALKTSDVDGMIQRVRNAGYEVTMEPKDVDIPSDPSFPVRIAFFLGPDGESVEFFHER